MTPDELLTIEAEACDVPPGHESAELATHVLKLVDEVRRIKRQFAAAPPNAWAIVPRWDLIAKGEIGVRIEGVHVVYADSVEQP